jgi:type III secretory pathway component EscS
MKERNPLNEQEEGVEYDKKIQNYLKSESIKVGALSGLIGGAVQLPFAMMRSVIMGNPPLAFQTVGGMMFFGKDIALATYAGLAIYFVVASIVGLIFGIVMTSKRLKPRTMSYGICLGIVAGLVAFSVLALPIITTIIPKEIVTWTHIQNLKLPTEQIIKGIKDSMFLTINNSIIIHIIYGATLGAMYTTLLRRISKRKVL